MARRLTKLRRDSNEIITLVMGIKAEKQAVVVKGNGEPPPFREWAKANLFIRKRGGGLVRFNEWRHGQDVLVDHWEAKRKAKQNIRDVVHKSRQVSSISTIVQAYFFYLIHFFPERAALVMAHLKDNSKIIFQNVDRFYHYLPDSEKEAKPVKGGRANKSDLEYERPHASQFWVMTAGSEDTGKAPMLNYVHISEHAAMINPQPVLDGLRPAIPDDVTWDTMEINESTAKGKNHFWEACQQAQDPDNDEWDFIFLSWKDEPTCVAPLAPGEEWHPTKDEEEYGRKYGLDVEQLNWARKTRKRKYGSAHGKNVWIRFHIDYPVVSELAFQYEGWPWFDHDILDKRLDEINPLKADKPILPVFRGHIDFASPTSTELILKPDDYGPLEIYRQPEEGHTYSFGWDGAHGVGGDFTEGCGLDNGDGEEVCHYRSNYIKPEEAAIVSFMIGTYYNCGLLGVESNGPGHTILSILANGSVDYPQLEGGYPNLYCDIKEDKSVGPEETQRLGFLTTSRSKEPALDNSAIDVNREIVKPRCKTLLLQMLGFARDETKRKWTMNHRDPLTEMYHDDGIIALAIAGTMRRKAGTHTAWIKTIRSSF